ncbi:MAG: glycosyltransferase [Planctomycetota bacterium]|nr:glycosyltransferase [Planctomycetota bacterium]
MPRDSRPQPGDRLQAVRVDAHCHSNASSGPAAAVLGLIGCPECYSEPEQVYDQAIARGMDLVALTDHDTIDGAMHLVERGFPNVVVGEEVTVYFPEDRCKLHVLVWNLTPALHEEIDNQGLRSDVYLFAHWLRDRNLAHSLAHPLYIQNHKLTRWHVERCALLFKGFETLNGAHSGTHRSVLDEYLARLSPGSVHRLIQDHNLEPVWPRIWEKARTGGSDDHGLLNVGRTWTAVPFDAATDPNALLDPREFFKAVMAGKSQPGGVAGHSSLLAHQLTTVGAQYYAEKVAPKTSPRARYAAAKILRFAGVDMKLPSLPALAWDTLKAKLGAKIGRKSGSPLLDIVRECLPPALDAFPDIKSRLGRPGFRGAALDSALADHDDMASFFDAFQGAVSGKLLSGAHKAARRRDKDLVREHIVSLLAVQAASIPYVFSLFHQNKERPFLERFAHEAFGSAAGSAPGEPGNTHLPISATIDAPANRPMKVALFTDTLADVNGVSRFIQNCATQAKLTGREFKALTSTRMNCPVHENIVNFDPVAATRMPKYENLEAALPPVLQMLRWVDRYQPDVIHVSTPGSVGLVGLLAARMLRCPVVGVYHTDFPAYVDHLFDDTGLTWSTSQYMKFFYKNFSRIFTRSQDYADSLAKLGLDAGRLVRLKPGIDIEAFHASQRDVSIWPSYGLSPTSVKVLYAGRVSVEKNLPALVSLWKQAQKRLKLEGSEAELVIIGDGPYRSRMQKDLAEHGAHFLGFRHGQELARLYASGDVFVFPSLTDTLGQVVMEAQASGMPVLVSNQGGPKEVVSHGRTGFVLPAERPQDWVDAIANLVGDGAKRRMMGQNAFDEMQAFSIRKSFDHYWSIHERAWREHLVRIGAADPASVDVDPAMSV